MRYNDIVVFYWDRRQSCSSSPEPDFDSSPSFSLLRFICMYILVISPQLSQQTIQLRACRHPCMNNKNKQKEKKVKCLIIQPAGLQSSRKESKGVELGWQRDRHWMEKRGRREAGLLLFGWLFWTHGEVNSICTYTDACTLHYAPWLSSPPRDGPLSSIPSGVCMWTRACTQADTTHAPKLHKHTRMHMRKM